MELRVCPECDKAFYAPIEEDYINCPHCGFVLLERRTSKRFSKKLDFTFTFNGNKVPAKLEDYSADGIRAHYKGQGLSVKTMLDLNIDELDIHRRAKAIWTKKLSGSISMSGFKLL